MPEPDKNQKNPPWAPLMVEMRADRTSYRLRVLREALDMERPDFAHFIGMDPDYYGKFERGERPISDPVAILIAERCDVTLDYLMRNRWGGLNLELAEKMRVAAARIAQEEEPKAS